MNMSEFFDVCEEFFNSINPNYCEDYEDYDDIKNEIDGKFWQFLDNFF
jgi:hypothetical protein